MRFQRHFLAVIVSMAFLVVGCSTQTTEPPTPYEDWQPSVSVDIPRAMSEAEKLSARDADIRTVLSQRGLPADVIDLNSIPVEKWVSDDDPDGMKHIGQCMRDSGMDMADDGKYHYDASQREAFALASAICHARFPTDPTYLQPFNTSQWNAVYEYQKDWLIPCLKQQDVTVSAAPSLEVFLAQNEKWSPYDDLDKDEMTSLTDICPYLPSNAVLYGQR
jgi:hypothetical protein